MAKQVRIGCSSGFWGDSPTAAHQLMTLSDPPLHYLVADYLAEVTMGILARSKTKNQGKAVGGMGDGGYVDEFVRTVYKPLMGAFADKRTKVVTNAGGMNPLGLKAAIENAARDAGLAVPLVAAVYGDDLLPRIDDLRAQGALLPFTTEGEQDAIPHDKVGTVRSHATRMHPPTESFIRCG